MFFPPASPFWGMICLWVKKKTKKKHGESTLASEHLKPNLPNLKRVLGYPVFFDPPGHGLLSLHGLRREAPREHRLRRLGRWWGLVKRLRSQNNVLLSGLKRIETLLTTFYLLKYYWILFQKLKTDQVIYELPNTSAAGGSEKVLCREQTAHLEQISSSGCAGKDLRCLSFVVISC